MRKPENRALPQHSAQGETQAEIQQLKGKVLNLTRWKSKKEKSSVKLESKLKDASIREMKARVEKKCLSVQLA